MSRKSTILGQDQLVLWDPQKQTGFLSSLETLSKNYKLIQGPIIPYSRETNLSGYNA